MDPPIEAMSKMAPFTEATSEKAMSTESTNQTTSSTEATGQMAPSAETIGKAPPFIATTSKTASSTETTSKPHMPYIVFVSLGDFTVDKLHLPGGRIIKDIIGGSGAFGTVGARLFAGRSRSQTIGYYLNGSESHSQWVKEQVMRWNTTIVRNEDFWGGPYKVRLQGNSSGGESPAYDMLNQSMLSGSTISLTNPLKDEEVPKDTMADLHNFAFLFSSIFHLTNAVEQLPEIVDRLVSVRKEKGTNRIPIILWEPSSVPSRPKSAEAFWNVASRADVLYLSNAQLAQLSSLDTSSIGMAKTTIQTLAWGFMKKTKRLAILIISSPSHGYYMCTRTKDRARWFHHYYEHDSITIMDGADISSAFMGGFGMVLSLYGSFSKACAAGVVAASFVLERKGLPLLRTEVDGKEVWNERDVWKRLSEYVTSLNTGAQVPKDVRRKAEVELARTTPDPDADEQARRLGMEIQEARRVQFVDIEQKMMGEHQ